MSSQSEYISMTIRLKNEMYCTFHRLVSAKGFSHVGVIRILIGKWVTENSVSVSESVSDSGSASESDSVSGSASVSGGIKSFHHTSRKKKR
jgi:hypothetical protein